MPYIWSALGVVAAIIVCGALRAAHAPLPNLSMIFLLAVLFAAVRFGIRAAIFASVLSFLAYNFFFVDPLYTFHVAEAHEFLGLTIFLVVAITASALAGRRDWLDLKEIAERVVALTRKRGATQSLQLALPGELPLIRADAVLAEQALGNLLNNAVLHTPKDAHVVIDAVIEPATVSLRVTDNGPGIPHDVLPRIFEKFVQRPRQDGARTNTREGTGLGLAIAKGIAEAHDGSIRAESPVSDGRGTRVVLTFPRTEVPA
jgi:two-component system, OmpR family, sensor histidine kinase KdpD